ncbi:MAG: radical SAM family heme chaperone HemW [Actinomycetota bacterium]
MTAVSPVVDSLEPRADVVHLAPAFGIYVHIPYCISRCPYCDFNTYVGIEDTAPEYVDALLREAGAWAERAGAREAGSIFIGGGTPSLLDPTLMRKLLDGLRATFPVSSAAEITIEANPETVDVERLSGFRAAGVNRISFGAQSFRADVLATLGRAHTAERTEVAVREAREAGFDNLNLDLIYGTPGESFDDWRMSMEKAIALEPEHISAYALTIEEGTAFGADVASGRMPAPDDDDQAAKYELALGLLAAAGYEHYEISNWAKPGRACRHNLLYWNQGEYAGLGAGAHGHLDAARVWNEKAPRTYIERAPDARAGEERLAEAARHDEWLQLRLRLVAGLDIDEASRRTGRDLSPALEHLERAGLVALANGVAKLTRRGLLLQSEVALRMT